MMTCSLCFHFLEGGRVDAAIEPKLNGRVGVCRRYPPRVFEPSLDGLDQIAAISAFPEVHPMQSCGEFRGWDAARRSMAEAA